MRSVIKKILKEYVDLEEARLSDIGRLSGSLEGSLARKIDDELGREFEKDKPLLGFMTFDRRFNNKKIRGNIKWNDNASHNLYKRIKERTSVLSVTEFNDLFKSAMNYIFPDSIGGLIRKNGRYCLYLKEENISIIFNVNFKDILKGNIELYIITVLPGRRFDSRKVFDIIEF